MNSIIVLKESTPGPMELHMKATGSKAKESIHGLMDRSTKELIKITKNMAREFISGLTGKNL